jgi:hypothetical protein
MCDDKHRVDADDTDRMPALFAILDAIREDRVERVFPNAARQFEGNAVLRDVVTCFVLVPFESHCRPNSRKKCPPTFVHTLMYVVKHGGGQSYAFASHAI